MGSLPNLLVQREGLHVELDYTGGPGDSPVYVGFALPGAATSDAVWKIMKLVYSGSNMTQLLWAGGSVQFVNVWDNRAGLTYS